jgi:two-component system cell cycle sensor histidine kinase/response regulator CckA
MARGVAPAALPTLCRSAAGARAVQLWVAPIADGGAVLSLVPEQHAGAEEVQARRLQAVGTLAAGVAHDFNNLLQAVIGAAEALAAQPGIAGDEPALILGGARRAAGLVAQLLALSRQQTLQPRVVAVNRAITDLLPLLRGSLGDRVRLVLELEEPGRTVRVDPGQLDQVLMNLVLNARGAMPQGGTLTLRTRRENLLAPRGGGGETIPAGRYLAIEVADTGEGIAPEVMGRIFEPFFTTRAADGRPGGGTGLGLATVMGIVRQSDGFLEVASTVGQGSRFRILLPRLPQAEVEAPIPAPVPVAAPPAGRTVLLVDDEEPVRRLAERALRRQGWEVLAAESGEAALALLADAPALACVVSDMVMPGMDGAALIDAVRQRVGAVPAVIMSGYAQRPRHAAMAAAATAFLAKPYAMRDLVALVGEVAGTQVPAELTGAHR